MDIFKPNLVLVETCAKCRVPMAPLLYADESCCPMWRVNRFGKTNYKCPKCGGEKDVQHEHRRRDDKAI